MSDITFMLDDFVVLTMVVVLPFVGMFNGYVRFRLVSMNDDIWFWLSIFVIMNAYIWLIQHLI